MAQVNDIFARFGIKVDKGGFAEATRQLKALREGFKAIEAEGKAATATSKSHEAALKVETQSLRNLEIQQRMEIRAQKESDRQRGTSLAGIRNFIIGVTAAGYAISRLTANTRQHVMAYRDYMTYTGMPLRNLQQFEAAAARVAPNLSGERIASELTTLQQNLTNIEFGQGNVFPYQLLGISATTKDATKIVNGLRNAISGLSNARAINLIERMGLSRDWLYILRMSREEFEKINAVMLSSGQVKNVTNMSLAFNQLKFSLGNLRDQIVALESSDLRDLFNNISGIADSMSRWFKEAPNAKHFFDALTIGLTVFLLRARPFILAMGTILGLIEDYWVAKQGGKSMLGWGIEDGKGPIDRASEAAKSWIAKTEGETAKKYGKDWATTYSEKQFWGQLFETAPTLEQQAIARDVLSRVGALGYTPMPNQNVINNNITMNGYSAQSGGELIGAMTSRQMQTSDLNMTSSQMTTIGSI